MLLLQNAAFLPLFRGAMAGRGEVKDVQLDRLEPIAPKAEGPDAVWEIFADVSRNPSSAAAKVLAHLSAQGNPKELIDAARVLVFLKGNNAHDYKFSSAVLEDYYHVSPEWRNRYLAASMFQLRGSGAADNELTARVRAVIS